MSRRKQRSQLKKSKVKKSKVSKKMAAWMLFCALVTAITSLLTSSATLYSVLGSKTLSPSEKMHQITSMQPSYSYSLVDNREGALWDERITPSGTCAFKQGEYNVSSNQPGIINFGLSNNVVSSNAIVQIQMRIHKGETGSIVL